MFAGRKKFGLSHIPRAITLVHITPQEMEDALNHFEQALAKEPFIRSEFEFEGMAESAPDVLVEQGRRFVLEPLADLDPALAVGPAGELGPQL